VQQEVPAKLLMVGDGPERPGAEMLSESLGLSQHVRFVGKQEQMEEVLAVADLFLLTSNYESFGLSALEAMAAHVPVISSNAGGIPEINIHGKTGYMANIGDVETMSRYAIELLQDEARLAAFKQQAYEHATQFDIQNIIPIYEDLYRSFCKAGCWEKA
jgi:N-acetyl-alpha-D-glucosaminyl L-malate synthase BshA